jgi:hypothetical protein
MNDLVMKESYSEFEWLDYLKSGEFETIPIDTRAIIDNIAKILLFNYDHYVPI